ncbi:MAG: hypothetical protein P4M14_06450 [Gammaproteobacteria bacterium]|nr:hypothetical protein [Gammaproteobacteria bacterium]
MPGVLPTGAMVVLGVLAVPGLLVSLELIVPVGLIVPGALSVLLVLGTIATGALFDVGFGATGALFEVGFGAAGVLLDVGLGPVSGDMVAKTGELNKMNETKISFLKFRIKNLLLLKQHQEICIAMVLLIR